MFLSEITLDIPAAPAGVTVLDWWAGQAMACLPEGFAPVRFVVTESDGAACRCEVTTVREAGLERGRRFPSELMFRYRQRRTENTASFNAVLLVPTGIGAAIGGHAGDATPVARLLASICDRLVTHPNVVNASDINELPENGLYVEGSVISRLLMGTAGLQPVRSNRVLALISSHPDPLFPAMAVNAVNAARASYGLMCPKVIELDPPLIMRSQYTGSARAAGEVEGLGRVLDVLDRHQGEYDAVAMSSVITVPFHYHGDYFGSDGSMVNPWGGVESMLTHTISSIYDVPSAHSPMLESQAAMEVDTGVVDPRLAAEAISLTFLQSVLKGLQRSPRIVTEPAEMSAPHVLSVEDVSCLVIPDGCLGLPTAAALQQGIPVIAVRENENLMRNNLSRLPWRAGQFHLVDNYWEAAGVMAAMRSGIDPGAVRRPIRQVTAERTGHVSGRA